MRRFFLLVGAILALLVLAATAAFASNGKSDAMHGKSSQTTHGKSAAARSATHGVVATQATSSAARGKGATKAHVRTETASSGKSAEAQHHVILCHRTGSDSNPYVVINVSVRAWEHGHTTHPEKDGRADILLKDPADPGEKMDSSLCQASAGVGGGGEGGVGGETGGETGGQVSGGGVAGTQAAGNVRSTSGGVLGAGGSAATRTLPFTGLPVWIVFLAGLGLLTTGLVVRRIPRSTH